MAEGRDIDSYDVMAIEATDEVEGCVEAYESFVATDIYGHDVSIVRNRQYRHIWRIVRVKACSKWTTILIHMTCTTRTCSHLLICVQFKLTLYDTDDICNIISYDWQIKGSQHL